MKRVKIRVYGLVQGVFFRANTKAIADKLGLRGYVKNMPDGTLEIIVEGKKEQIKKLIEFAKKGPPGAIVKKIQVKEEEIKDFSFKDFSIIYF